MKRLMTIAGVTILGIFSLQHSGVASATLLFLLTGAIPSTNYSLPPMAMFVFMTIGFWLLIAGLSHDWIRKNLADKRHHGTSHIALPKRRYSKTRLS